jgi:hypothetical protein
LCFAAACGRIDFDPSGSSGSSGSCSAPRLFCDDFESGDIGKWTSAVNAADTALTVDTTHAHGGRFALEAAARDTSATGGCFVFLNFPAQTGVLAMRTWVLGAEQITSGDCPLLVSAATPADVGACADGSSNWLVREVQGASTRDHNTLKATAPANTWTCVELDYDVASAGIGFYIDDVAIVNVPAILPLASVNSLSVGAISMHTGGADIFADDVVVSTEHIGCN